MLRADHDFKKFNAIKEASKTIREKITRYLIKLKNKI